MAATLLNQKDIIDRYRSIYFVPDYLLDALNERKITLTSIDNETYQWANTRNFNQLATDADLKSNNYEMTTFSGYMLAEKNTIEGKRTVNDKPNHKGYYNELDDKALPNRLLKAISKNDLIDWGYLNYMMKNLLLHGRLNSLDTDSGALAKPYEYLESSLFCNTLLNSADSQRCLTSLLDVFSNSDITDAVIMNGYKVYSVVPTSYTMFVVLHSGFSNILASSSVELRSYFFRSLMKDLIKVFSLDIAVHLDIFASYLRHSFRNSAVSKLHK